MQDLTISNSPHLIHGPDYELGCYIVNDELIVYDHVKHQDFLHKTAYEINYYPDGRELVYMMDSTQGTDLTLALLLADHYDTVREWIDNRYFRLVVYDPRRK